MKSASGRGVVCDLCRSEFNDDFTYYSYDLRLLHVTQNRKPPLTDVFRQPVTRSLDLCAACHGAVAAAATAQYAPLRVGTRCDLSRQALTGTYDYYHVNVTHVTVRPGAGGLAVATDARHLELDVSVPAADARFHAKESQWTTK